MLPALKVGGNRTDFIFKNKNNLSANNKNSVKICIKTTATVVFCVFLHEKAVNTDAFKFFEKIKKISNANCNSKLKHFLEYHIH